MTIKLSASFNPQSYTCWFVDIFNIYVLLSLKYLYRFIELSIIINT